MRFRLSRLLAVVFVLAVCFHLRAQNPPVTINVDAQANRKAISPLIYGVNYFEAADVTTMLQDLNSPINRYGGNRASTYNWNLNSDNRGFDYFYESISDDTTTAGARGDIFINATQSGNAEPMVTIPLLDWVAKAGTAQPFPCSYPKSIYADQYQFEGEFDPACGDGLNPDQSQITGADPSTALTANTIDTQKSWVQQIVATHGLSNSGGLKYYILDNEHDLWYQTHHDAVPDNPHYSDDLSRMVNYAAMIKSVDANALVVGPEVSGWLGYLLSPYDYEYGQNTNWANGLYGGPDRASIGAVDYAPWLLSQFKAYADAHGGQRLLDVFTVHYYPQGGDNNINTRSLWDPNYVDPSYIGDKIMLIPRMKQWVAANYPGTKIGITEYNWGAINNEAMYDNIGYAVTQADVLGIFGREGLDLATRFNAPPSGYPSYNAMKMYRNYDGNKSTFGDVSVSATSATSPDNFVAFAGQRTSDNKLTVIVLSKYATANTNVTVNLANFTAASTAQVWQLSGNGSAIQHLADASVSNSTLTLSVPAQSITLLVLSPQTAGASVTPATVNFGNQLVGSYSPNSTVTLTNTGSSDLTVSSISLTGTGLRQVNNCPASLAVGANCMVAIEPTSTGALSGTLTFTDGAPDSPQHVAITGTGTTLSVALTRPTRGTVPASSQSSPGSSHKARRPTVRAAARPQPQSTVLPLQRSAILVLVAPPVSDSRAGDSKVDDAQKPSRKSRRSSRRTRRSRTTTLLPPG